MSKNEMVIFTRTHDLLTWLVPTTNNFPRAHRHTVTKRLLDAAFDLRENLEIANLRRGTHRRQSLQTADEALALLRFYLRLVTTWGWISNRQYGHVSEMLSEVGRLLGGWKKAA